MSFKQIITIGKDAFSNWSNDNVASWSAALSYYTAFSLSPLLLLVISLVSLFISRQTIQTELTGQVGGLIGDQGATLIRNILTNAKDQHSGLLATIISFVLLALGASGVFGQLKNTLNTIFHVEPKPNQGVIKIVKDRFLSFSMVVVISFLLIVSLVASAAISVISSYFTQLLPIPGIALEGVNLIISFIFISALFVVIFAVLPDVKIPRKVLILGAVSTAFLFTVGKTLIGFYLGRGTTSSFGAAASLATILLWIYYSSLIFFFGAELMKSYAYSHNLVFKPKKDAKMEKPKVIVEPKIQETGRIETALTYIISGIFLGIFSKLGLGKKHRETRLSGR